MGGVRTLARGAAAGSHLRAGIMGAERDPPARGAPCLASALRKSLARARRHRRLKRQSIGQGCTCQIWVAYSAIVRNLPDARRGTNVRMKLETLRQRSMIRMLGCPRFFAILGGAAGGAIAIGL